MILEEVMADHEARRDMRGTLRRRPYRGKRAAKTALIVQWAQEARSHREWAEADIDEQEAA